MQPARSADARRSLAFEDIAEAALARAKAAGAEAAEAVAVASTSRSVDMRMAKLEELEHNETCDLSLRVFVGRGQAIVSTNELNEGAVAMLAERAVAMARAAPEDPHAGLAPAELLAGELPDLDLADAADPSVEALGERARAAEDAALAVSGVSNSMGAGAGAARSRASFVTSTGFSGAYDGTRHWVSVSAVAGEGTRMVRDHDHASTRHLDELQAAEEIGRNAGERAVRRLNPAKPNSGPVSVVFEPRTAGSLVGHLAGAVNGRAVARGASFLAERMGEAIFASGIQVVDDPLRPRGLRSRPFDGEGLAGARLALIADGRLAAWLLDLAAARQLGLAPSGNASRGLGAPPAPGPSNLALMAGSATPEALIGGIDRGILVTSLIGMGVNGVTGDYSRGAEGFLIENGEVKGPVSEVTIAGNLLDMFARLTPANDLVYRYGTDAPTLAVEGMTLAGG